MQGIGLFRQISSRQVEGLQREGCDDLAGQVARSLFIHQLCVAALLAYSWATVVQSDCVAVPLPQGQASSQCCCLGLGALEELIAGSCQVGVNRGMHHLEE